MKDGPLTDFARRMREPRKFTMKKSAILMRLRGLFIAQVGFLAANPLSDVRADVLDCLKDLKQAEELLK